MFLFRFLTLFIVYLCDIPILDGDSEFYEQAEEALLRIRKEIQQLQGNQPKRDFYETIHDLYEDLIKKSDFREIEQLQKYLDVLLVIRDKMAAHAPEEEIRSLQVNQILSKNNLLEINTNSK